MDEQLINRIRLALHTHMSRDELVAHFTDRGIAIEHIFLAYHAALILEKDASVP